MTIILIILGVGAALGVGSALINRERPEDVAGAALGGAFLAGSCMLQLLIPAVMLLVGLWLLGKIMGY